MNATKIDIENSFLSREASSASSVKTQNDRVLKDFSMSQQNWSAEWTQMIIGQNLNFSFKDIKLTKISLIKKYTFKN